MTTPQIVILESAPSTNSAPQITDSCAPHGLTVAAHSQTAGRGQRGNSWEAAPGMNLTFSTLLRPQNFPARKQFLLSMAVALAVANVVMRELDNAGAHELAAKVRVKWPNDIYVDNRKIAGILIENTLHASMLSRTVVGVGLNVNQDIFVSDAPNPVSLKQLTGVNHPLLPLLQSLAAEIVAATDNAAGDNALAKRYNSMLWRADGVAHPWIHNASGRTFMASINHVATDGMLSLNHTIADIPTTFAFKEVAPVL